MNDQHPAPHLWVVLISWNNRSDVLRCLGALQQQTHPHVHVRLALVDNGSTDGTPQAVRQHFPQVRLFRLAHNYGFARAANVVLRYALNQQADYVLLLNSDTWFEPDFLERLVSVAQHHRQCGIISPKVCLHNAPETLWGVGGLITRGGVRFVGLHEPDTGQYDDSRSGSTDDVDKALYDSLDFVFGCAMLIRTDVLRDTGLMDGRFFVFYEEMDLCVRARRAGWRVGLASGVRLLHEGSGTTRHQSALRHFYLARSRLAFLRKHCQFFNLVVLSPYELALTAKVVGTLWRQRDYRAGVAYVRGCIAGLTQHGVQMSKPRKTLASQP